MDLEQQYAEDGKKIPEPWRVWQYSEGEMYKWQPCIVIIDFTYDGEDYRRHLHADLMIHQILNPDAEFEYALGGKAPKGWRQYTGTSFDATGATYRIRPTEEVEPRTTTCTVWRKEWNCYNVEYDLNTMEGISDALSGELGQEYILDSSGYGSPVSGLPEDCYGYNADLVKVKEKLLAELLHHGVHAGFVPEERKADLMKLFLGELK